MRKIIIAICILLASRAAMAQQELAFPFQGGNKVMGKFFKDSLMVTPEIIKKRATGTAVFKFTADEKGNIKKIIIYYADDYVLTIPIIEALKRSNHKWIIPDKEKVHDFILPFSINFIPPPTGADKVEKEAYDYYVKRKPYLSYDQIPLDMATLLPTVTINYSLK